MYTADPSAHVFGGKIYIYHSNDIESGVPFDDLGSHFAMEDYHVISMDSPHSIPVDNGVALHVNDVSWAEKTNVGTRCSRKRWHLLFIFPC